MKSPAKKIQSDGYEIAAVYAGLGEKDQALAYLGKEYATGGWMLDALEVDPYFAPLHSDERFKEMLRRVGLSKSREECPGTN